MKSMLCLPADVAVSKKNITEYLARQIIGGQLQHNEILPNEIDFASGLGVSRTMIRDVLRSLEGKGLIERKTNVGTRVRSIHSWNLLDQDVLDWSCGILTQKRFLLSLMELRLIIEPQAAALAALRADDKNVIEIRANFERMLADDSEPDNVVLDTAADIAFHKSIIAACGNLFLAQFGSAVKGALHHTIYLANKIRIDHGASLECHRRVLTAIEDRDSKAAYAGMCCVLSNAITDLELKLSGVILVDREDLEKGKVA